MASAVAISKIIIGEAISIGGDTWARIEEASRIYVRGFAQNLVDIARGVERGEISKTDGKLYAANARFLLSMMIANMAQIIFSQVQLFLNKVFSAVRGLINTALGVPLL